ncbi:hypothetical protein U9M48_040300, partial [Paspalum notatum var. saurae]
GLASIGDTLPLCSCAVLSSFRSLFLLLCGAHPDRGPCSSSPCRSLGSCLLVESTVSTRCSCRPREEVPAPPCTLQTTEEKCQRVELRAGAASLILVSWVVVVNQRREPNFLLNPLRLIVKASARRTTCFMTRLPACCFSYFLVDLFMVGVHDINVS